MAVAGSSGGVVDLVLAYQVQGAALAADAIQGHGAIAAQQQQVGLGQRVKLQVTWHSCLVQLHCTHHLQSHTHIQQDTQQPYGTCCVEEAAAITTTSSQGSVRLVHAQVLVNCCCFCTALQPWPASCYSSCTVTRHHEQALSCFCCFAACAARRFNFGWLNCQPC